MRREHRHPRFCGSMFVAAASCCDRQIGGRSFPHFTLVLHLPLGKNLLVFPRFAFVLHLPLGKNLLVFPRFIVVLPLPPCL